MHLPARRSSLNVVRVVAALALAGGAAAVAAPAASASCDGPMVPFERAATSARTIVVGEVTALDAGERPDADGRATHFTLRVQYVLRGHAAASMHVRGLAYLPCADHVIRVGKGDRIGLAIGARDFQPRISFSSATWIRGDPAPPADVPTMTLAAVFKAAGLAPPGTATAVAAPPPDAPAVPLVALLAGLVGGAAFLRRLANLEITTAGHGRSGD